MYRHCSLIGAEPGSYYGAGIHFHNDSAWDYAWPDLQRPIGQPAGPAGGSADGGAYGDWDSRAKTLRRLTEWNEAEDEARIDGGAANGGAAPPNGVLAPPRVVRRGDIIAFYNKLFIPLMKQFVVRMKEKAAEKKEETTIQDLLDDGLNDLKVRRAKGSKNITHVIPVTLTFNIKIPDPFIGISFYCIIFLDTNMKIQR